MIFSEFTYTFQYSLKKNYYWLFIFKIQPNLHLFNNEIVYRNFKIIMEDVVKVSNTTNFS